MPNHQVVDSGDGSVYVEPFGQASVRVEVKDTLRNRTVRFTLSEASALLVSRQLMDTVRESMIRRADK